MSADRKQWDLVAPVATREKRAALWDEYHDALRSGRSPDKLLSAKFLQLMDLFEQFPEVGRELQKDVGDRQRILTATRIRKKRLHALEGRLQAPEPGSTEAKQQYRARKALGEHAPRKRGRPPVPKPNK
jgi:hypothetical protein